MTQEAQNIKYLGIAVKHPIQISNGLPVLSKGVSAVEEAIITILNTPVGSRFMLPEYGSRLHELIFEPNDEFLVATMRRFIVDALEIWEKRVSFVEASFNVNVEKVDVTLTYSVLDSNEIESFVYPFYRSLIS